MTSIFCGTSRCKLFVFQSFAAQPLTLSPETPTMVPMLSAPATVDEVLDAMSGRAAVASQLECAQGESAKRIQRVRYTHDAMIDLIIEKPAISQGEIASIFGYTQSWVSIVFNSDAFQARLAQRKDELVNPAIRVTLNERFNAVVSRSLEVLQEKLAKDSAAIPDNLVLKAVELGSKALGLGGNAPPAPAPGGDRLNALADRLLALQGGVRSGVPYVDMVPTPLPAPVARDVE